VRFSRTNPSGCSAVVAHLLWEPFVPERCRPCAFEHGSCEREPVEYCAVQADLEGALTSPLTAAVRSVSLQWVLVRLPTAVEALRVESQTELSR
jgi:hypothetical protein